MKLKKRVKKFRQSVWFFPVLLLFIFSILASFKISGSSIGYYQNLLYGKNDKDSSLIYGKPAGIRSDEWLVWTQLTISQSENNFNKYNPDLGSGRDLSLHFDIPTNDWSAVFKPQNWSFLVLPLEYALAVKWWFLMYLLIISAYFFTLKAMPGKRLFSAVISTAFALSPFVLWWYQSPVLGLMGYGFLLILLIRKIIDNKKFIFKNKSVSDIALIATTSFVGMCFALLLYPPFQISIAIVIAFYTLGYLLKQKLTLKKSYIFLLKRLAILAGAGAIILFISLLFIHDKQPIINNLNSSVYPGQRVVPSGSRIFNPYAVFDGYLMPLLQISSRASNYYTNQSEASNFILTAPLLIAPILFLLYFEYKKRRKIDWLNLSLLALAVILISRVYIHFGDVFYKMFLLHKVPHRRLLISFGFLGFILAVHYLAKLKEIKIPAKVLRVFSWSFAVSLFISLSILTIKAAHKYPNFLHRYREGLILALSFSIIYFFLAKGRKMLFAISLLGFTLLSSFRIMPLYRGLGPVYHSQLTQAIDRVSEPQDDWITVGQFLFEQVPLFTGNRSFSGVQIYPEKSFWLEKYGNQYEFEFNRKGHVTYGNTDDKSVSVKLLHTNQIRINFSCQDKFIRQEVEYVLSETEINNKTCLNLKDEVKYPAKTFYIYSVEKL